MTSTAAGITVKCRVTGDTDIQLGTPTLSSKVLFEKLALLLPQLVKKFPLIYGSQMLFTVFTTARNMSLSSLRQSTLFHHISLCPFNIILPSTLRSSKWSLSSRFPNHNSVCILQSSGTWSCEFRSMGTNDTELTAASIFRVQDHAVLPWFWHSRESQEIKIVTKWSEECRPRGGSRFI
jgi:hypothetical protein